MLKIIFILSLLSTSIFSCRTASDWVPSTIEESYQLAGAVVVGEVIEEPEPDRKEFVGLMFLAKNSVKLKNVVYYKGCGPSEIKVKGFSTPERCGVAAAKPGTKVLVFICPQDDLKEWSINQYTAYAGQVIATEENINKVLALSSEESECSLGHIRSLICQKREIKKANQN